MISAMKFNITLFDYFRYLVLFRVGGVYTDIDVSPIVPIEQWAGENAALASLITGWEVRLPKSLDLSNSSFVRHDQLQQWTITAAPMHPALLSTMRHIADNFNSGDVDNTLAYTGP